MPQSLQMKYSKIYKRNATKFTNDAASQILFCIFAAFNFNEL